MNFQRHRRVKPKSLGALPMTSMIDVVFLLLVFFMVTASMAPKESELGSALQASEKGESAAADLQPQIVRVERTEFGAAFRVGQRVLSTQEELTELLGRLPKEAGVFVRVSDDVPVRAATSALQACKDAEFTKITYVPAE